MKKSILRLAVLLTIFTLLLSSGQRSQAGSSKLLFEQPITDFKARRERLMEKVKDGVIVIMGEAEDGSLGVDAKFRQNDNFMYLTGVEVPGSILLLAPKGFKGSKEWLFIPQRNPGEEQWTGPQPEPNQETADQYGVERIGTTVEFAELLYTILESNPPTAPSMALHTIVPVGTQTRLFTEQNFVQSVRKKSPNTPILPLASTFAELRMVKTEAETAQIQRAINITAKAQEKLRNNIKPGMFEYELEGIIMGEFYRGGAQRAAFPCIVGSGFYSTVLHYERNRKKIDDGDLVVVDIGAEYNYYAADITRTYPANGRFTSRQREIYKLVLEAQTAAAAAYKPGHSTLHELQEVAKKVMQRSPLRDGKGLTLDNYFLHGLGHFLGMKVHDVGDYGRPLPVGAVFTIEPGIYLAEEKLGVRIEDDYLVTQTGLVKLSRDIPSDPDLIERLMAKQN